MSGFLNLFDQEVGDFRLYKEVKMAFADDCDLEVLMTVFEDLSKPPQEFLARNARLVTKLEPLKHDISLGLETRIT